MKLKKDILGILETTSKLISTNKKFVNTWNITELVYNISQFERLFQEDRKQLIWDFKNVKIMKSWNIKNLEILP